VPTNKQNRGTSGEKIAQNYLEKRGYKHLDSQWHSRYGEIDLVMKENDELVFVEVKLRKNNKYGHPEEMVTRDKTEKIKKTALEYIAADLEKYFWRFDIVAITGNILDYEIHHFRDTIRED